MKHRFTNLAFLLLAIGILLASCGKDRILRVEVTGTNHSSVYVYKVTDITYDTNNAVYYNNTTIDWSKYDTSIMEQQEVYVIDQTKKENNDKISFHVQIPIKDSTDRTSLSAVTVSAYGTIMEISKVFCPQKTDKADTYIISYYSTVKQQSSFGLYSSVDSNLLAFLTLKEAEDAIEKTTLETAKSNVMIFYE